MQTDTNSRPRPLRTTRLACFIILAATTLGCGRAMDLNDDSDASDAPTGSNSVEGGSSTGAGRTTGGPPAGTAGMGQTTGGSGGGSNTGGGLGTGGAAHVQDYVSGTRLTANSYSGSDGSKAPYGAPFHDNTVGEDCSLVANGNTLYCLPGFYNPPGYYTDNTCSSPAACSALCSATTHYAYTYAGTSCSSSSVAVNQVSTQKATKVYQKSGSTCTDVTSILSGIYNCYPVGAQVSLSTFVSFTK